MRRFLSGMPKDLHPGDYPVAKKISWYHLVQNNGAVRREGKGEGQRRRGEMRRPVTSDGLGSGKIPMRKAKKSQDQEKTTKNNAPCPAFRRQAR